MLKKTPFHKLLFILAFILASLVVFNIQAKNAKVLASSCTPPATTYGTDTLTLSVPSTNTYTIWTRLEAPSASSNSILMSIDGTNCYDVGGNSSIPVGSWTWVNYSDGNTSSVIKLSLSNTSTNHGNHTVVLTGIESGVSIDRIEALSDSSCVPTGTGDNCAPSSVAPPTVSFSAPASGATVSGNAVNLSANAAAAIGVTQVGIAQVQFEVDGSVIATDTQGPYSTSWDSTKATDGSHTLTAIATDTQGQSTTTTETVTVNNTKTAGDLNGDGTVNILDLSILLSHWGQSGATASQGDLNGDGTVSILDLSILLSHWGQ